MEENIYITDINKRKADEEQSMQSVRLEFKDVPEERESPEPSAEEEEEGAGREATATLGDFDFGTDVKINLPAANDEADKDTAL